MHWRFAKKAGLLPRWYLNTRRIFKILYRKYRREEKRVISVKKARRNMGLIELINFPAQLRSRNCLVTPPSPPSRINHQSPIPSDITKNYFSLIWFSSFYKYICYGNITILLKIEQKIRILVK